jgi:transposase
MRYIQGTPREEVILFPQAIDDYISQDNPVRFIDAFVYSLDLKNLEFSHSTPSHTGRPAYNPADLLKLYIYGYINRIRSSRMLEKECQRNLELMWLVRKLSPDFKTIADFRKDNLGAIKQVCREFSVVCKGLELFGCELIVVDGSKFKAVNSKKRNFNAKRLEKAIKKIDAKIEKYLKELEEQDKRGSEVKIPTGEELKEKIKQLKERKQQYGQLQQRLRDSGQSQISLTDADSRSMKCAQGEADVCYNVQTAVDSKNKLIVDVEVTNEVNDRGQLFRMGNLAKQTLGVDKIEALTDMGYYDADEVEKCEKEGITVYIDKPNTSSSFKNGLFSKGDFIYDSHKDVYVCPAGEELRYRYQRQHKGKQVRYYSTSACGSCEIKRGCTRNKGNRKIMRLVNEDVIERMAQRVRGNPEKMKLRKEIVEHPFGTIKRWMGQGYFLMKGIKKVAAEISLTVLGYNIKRVINIVGVQKMIEAVVHRINSIQVEFLSRHRLAIRSQNDN